MKLSKQQGILLALAAALVSGISIYINKFGVAQVKDPFVYTTVKNSAVVIGLLVGVGLLASWKELRALTPTRWFAWIGLGAWQVLGLAVLAVGQFLLQPPTSWKGWGTGETLILIATLLWAVETMLAKKVLGWMSAQTAALGRMGIGALVMWVFLTITGRAGMAFTLNGTQWLWIVVTAVFLMAYVWTWYSALKWAPATLVTSVLTIGAIVTILLSAVIDRHAATAPQLVALALLVVGAALFALPRRVWRRQLVEAA